MCYFAGRVCLIATPARPLDNRLSLACGFMDMRLEVVPVPVRDVDAAKDFYIGQVGFHLDHDVTPTPDMRVVQMTPPGWPAWW